MKKYVVSVESEVEVWIDESKFDEPMLASFREQFYPFFDIKEHVEHLAQLCSRGIAEGTPSEFISGYGRADLAGIRVRFGEVIDVSISAEDAG